MSVFTGSGTVATALDPRREGVWPSPVTGNTGSFTHRRGPACVSQELRVGCHLHPQLLAGSPSGPCVVATGPASPWGTGNGAPLLGVSVRPSAQWDQSAPSRVRETTLKDTWRGVCPGGSPEVILVTHRDRCCSDWRLPATHVKGDLRLSWARHPPKPSLLGPWRMFCEALGHVPGAAAG